MRPLEILLLVVDLLAFIALAVPRLAPRRWAGWLAPAALLAAGVQVLFEGYRWGMVPAYVLAVAFLLAWLLRKPAAPVRARRFTTGLAHGLGVLGLAASAALPALFPVFRFPKPGGPYGIGTLTYHWVDANRAEIFSTAADARRELMAQVWYPARDDPSAPRAPYIQDAGVVLKALAEQHGLPGFILQQLKYTTSNAVAAAPIAADAPAYPVVIFLEGATGYRQMNTFQVEELVSHGYIVVGIDQPYMASAVVFPDGRRVIAPSFEALRPVVRQSYLPAASAPELNGQAYPNGVVPYLAQDVSFTLDQLAALNRSDPNGILAGRLDLERSGVIGMSLGGLVGGEACRADPRLSACLILDAPMPVDVVQAGLKQPAMWITRDADSMRLERERSGGWSEEEIEVHQTSMRATYASLPGDGYFIRVPGIFHISPTDAPAWMPLWSWLGLAGTLEPQRVYTIVNAYTLAFFDRELKGQPAPLLDGSAQQFPEVIFKARRP